VISLWRASNRISSPLRDIAQVMRRFSGGDRGARALESGPDEARTISHIYNHLIEQQEQQARTLEDTVRRRTQESRDATLAAQDAERYKTTFMAHISHNMRTPLHVIQAQASEVMHELEFLKDSAQARSHLEIIEQQSAELALRVTQVLELVRGDTAKDAIHLERLSLSVFRDLIRDKTQSLAKVNNNRLIIHSDEADVLTDIDMILQILSNLIDNACKYTKDGTIDTRITYAEEHLVITVSDTGIGIPSQALPHVWREFRQVQSVDGRRVEGFGLGLAIVRRYATLLGGACEIASTVGQGTTVSVTVPAQRASSAII
jgi:signal transduction histidine kinase